MNETTSTTLEQPAQPAPVERTEPQATVERQEDLRGDFAAGERTEPQTAVEEQQAGLEGDFAAGERTEPQTAVEQLEAGLHGDFPAGERTLPLTPDDDVPGTFADTSTADTST